ncbi:MAG TPA: GNAT family protein [Aliidongia sp.]|uniref:GNAT family N-acetyltransferase n=1 Tax=Aliidongia sp. TaxID=1914230 RepID=UPI002DDD996B|nr:GNAT family protein [Aliidongia sp.]HEV2673296.1 GNAT family protein [Aliidongia sp.]
MKNAFLTYRPVAIDDAEMLLRWRTSPTIGQYMLTEVDQDTDRQRSWIAGTNARTDLVHRIIRVKGEDVGYCSVKITDATARIGTVGIYIGEPGTPTSLSAFNFIHILNHAFHPMGLHKIVNHILATNDRLLPAQKFNGYRHVGTLREHVLKHGQWLDMHIFEQTERDWMAFRCKFEDWRDLDGALWPPE